jgi:predicted MFS family arabinose efflux permease
MKKVIYILAFGAFGIVTTEMGVIGIMPDVARDLNITIETAGWLLSAFAITIALIAPIAVLLTAKINRKLMMAIVLLSFVVSSLVSFLSPNFTVLMIARLVPAFLHPVFWSIATATAAKLMPGKDAPKAVGIVFAGISIAAVLGIPLSTYTSSLLGWRFSFLLGGIINLSAFALLSIFVPSMPSSAESGDHKEQLAIFKKPGLWVAVSTVLLMVSGMFGTFSYMATYLQEVTKMNGRTISIMLLVFGVAGTLGNWLAGKALSKNIVVTTRSFIILLVTIHIIAYSVGTSFWAMAILMFAWGFVHTSGFLISNICITNEAPEAPELAGSLMVSFANSGVAIGTFLGGIVITQQGVLSLLWLSVSLLFAALIITFIPFKKII